MKINEITNANGIVTTTVLNTKIGEVEIKTPDVRKNILLLLIIINLRVIYLMQR